MPSDGARGPLATKSSSRSPLNNHQSKKEDRKSRDINFLQKLAFTRAVSEPPSANKNAVLPVTEDYDDEHSSSEDLNRAGGVGAGNIGKIHGMLEPVDEEEP